MREIALGLALLLGASASSAAEGQTLCSTAVSAFDGKELPAIQEFFRAALALGGRSLLLSRQHSCTALQRC